MNLLEKLRKARIDFQSACIKKSGKNEFTKFTYYELSDILPTINILSEKYGFFCAVSFTPELATLQVIDTEDSKQSISFTSPMSTADLKGNHMIQNLGAVQTYLRRYLYLCAMEIVESDELDGAHGKPTSLPSKPKEPVKAEANLQDDRKKMEEEFRSAKDELKAILSSKLKDGSPAFTDLEYKQVSDAFLKMKGKSPKECLMRADSLLDEYRDILEERNRVPIMYSEPEDSIEAKFDIF